MFETASTDLSIRRNRLLFYETLPVSIAIHALAVAAIVGVAVSQVFFPDVPPRLLMAYRLAAEPDPPPPPPPPPPPRRAVMTPQTVVQQMPKEIVAPTIIPETIPIVPQIITPATVVAQVIPENEPEGVDGGVEGGVMGGVIGGDTRGEVGGSLGGVIGGIPNASLGDDGRVHIARDKPMPLFIERQDYPDYPENARISGHEDVVVVRYIIGTNGRVTSVEVIEKAKRKAFDESAVKAIKNWRFRPLMVNGQPQEVVHELTVYYRLN